MNFDRSFYEARKREKYATSDNPENDAVVRKALESLQLRPGDRVLDFGCGDGYFIERLARGALGITAVGFDLVSNPQWGRRDGAIRFDSGSLPMPYADASFDAVFCSQVIEHVPDPAALAIEFARVLKPGGRAWVATPNAFAATWRIFHAHQHRVDAIEGHYRHFSEQELRELFEPLGFRLLQTRYDTFLCLYLYYRFVAYNPALKKHLLSVVEPGLVNPTEGTARRKSALSAVAKPVAFAMLRAARWVDERFAHYPGCQVIEVTLVRV